jgi:hypothetical protein
VSVQVELPTADVATIDVLVALGDGRAVAHFAIQDEWTAVLPAHARTFATP